MGTDSGRTRPWQGRLDAGHRPVQDEWNSLVLNARTVRSWEPGIIPGLFQTADYARCVFDGLGELRDIPKDTGDAVGARLQRQEWLRLPDRTLHQLIWEGALHARLGPPSVMAAQLDRILAVSELDTVSLGVVPFSAGLRLLVGSSFTMVDERLVVVEDWHAEHWLDDTDAVALHRKVWDAHARSAVYGDDARQIIERARRSLAD
ncbi:MULTISPECIES: DUF5753 domain-containing protein [Streptomyces]|uniref:DUF5753 domain-containing protein n=1 Tax=Streptomyces doudnae TaxID=3075536 RepID=A0ABD5EUU4_9ACTN|nr:MULTISPECIES: DUF5753 domain-containing protein [unclassified Streptomyces]MDT0438124.1 DUF5753 domain-containing protein [Streptomyces sp. DSM 41981]SCD93206.1 hypothetical protein GA0115242_117329 [Streptomyces sp. SolWspMP-5a-2]